MKRFLALLLALAMLLCLAACGQPSNPDDSGKGDGGKTPDNTPKDLVMGMSIQDVDALVTILTGGESDLDLKNVYFEVGTSEKAGLLSLGAQILGEQYDVDLFLGEEMVLSAPSLLDENYGAPIDVLTNMVEVMLESYLYGQLGSVSPDTGSAANMLPIALLSMDSEVIAEIVDRYYDLGVAQLKKADGITASTQSGHTVINGTLTPAATATIIVNLVNALCEDDALFETLAPLVGAEPEELQSSLVDSLPESDALKTNITDMLSAYSLSIQMKNVKLTEENVLVSGELYISADQELETDEVRLAEISLVLDTEAGTVHAYVKDEGTELMGIDVADGKYDFRANVDGSSTRMYMESTETTLKGYVEMQGEKIAELDFTHSETETNFKLVISRSEYVVNIKTEGETVTGVLTMDGQEMGKLIFDKKVSGSKTTYTVKSLTINATTVDFSAAGIGFYIDEDAKLPSVPTSYTPIADMDSEDMQAVLEEFSTDHADLIQWITDNFSGGSVEDSMASRPNEY